MCRLGARNIASCENQQPIIYFRAMIAPKLWSGVSRCLPPANQATLSAFNADGNIAGKLPSPFIPPSVLPQRPHHPNTVPGESRVNQRCCQREVSGAARAEERTSVLNGCHLEVEKASQGRSSWGDSRFCNDARGYGLRSMFIETASI